MSNDDLVRIDERAGAALEQARSAGSGRAADTVYGGSTQSLRQTLIGLVAGAELSEHESPGDATLHVLSGTVELRSGESSCTLAAGQLAPIPRSRHSVLAADDSVLLLTVAK